MRALIAILILGSTALAQDEAKEPELHKIYVPYDRLDEVLGTKKERVLVPYEEFRELWKLKYGPKRGADEPPVPYMVESASYEGRVREGIAEFTATIGVEVFEERWQRIPLAFRGVAFEEVLVDGAPGVLAPTKKGYDLLLRGKGRHEVRARFVAGVSRGKELASTSFGLPSVPLHRLRFRVPGRGTDVRIEPARAHTTTTEGDDTVLLAFLGPQSQVKLTWRFQPEEEEKEPSLLFGTDVVDLLVEERVMRGTAVFHLEVLRSPTRDLRLRIPEGVQVLEVRGPALRTWGFEDRETRRLLQVSIHNEVLGKYRLEIGFEAPVQVPGTISVPAFAVEGATRERGYLRVRSAEGVGLRPARTENVFQVDLNALPKEIRGGERALGFRFPALPFALTLETERIRPRVTLATRARLLVEQRTMTLRSELSFQVERAGLFQLLIELPEGISVTEVGGAKLVDAWRETVEDGTRLLEIDLKGRRIGSFTLPIEAVAPVDVEGGELRVPFLRVRDVDRRTGTLGVFLDPGIKATATTEGVVPLEPAEFRRRDAFKAPDELPLAFAWRWRGDGASVVFAIERRKPKVTCDARYLLHGEEGRVRVRVELAYRVQYTGVRTFRFRFPEALAERLEVETQNLREKSFAADPDEEGQDPGTATYTVELQSPALGEVVLRLEYDEVFERPLKVDETRVPEIPAFVPLDVERTTTWGAVRKAPVIKVEVTSADYEQIDPSELPQALRSDDVFLALRRFDDPAPFRLLLTKHRYHPVADLVVRHAHLETVIAAEGRATTTAFFEILNNDRQFLAVRLPEGASVQELQVDGKPEKPRVGEGGVLLVRLVTGLRKDQTFVVAMAYTHAVETRGALFRRTRLEGPTLPATADAPAPVQALLTWRVHWPGDWSVGGFDGNVRPAGDDADRGSWLARAIRGLGRLLEPSDLFAGEARARSMPDIAVKGVSPVYRESDSESAVFTNGTGDARLEIRHTSGTARVVFVFLALALTSAAIVVLSRWVKPFHAGGAILVLALLFLAVAGPGSAPVWNGIAAAAAVTTALLVLREARRFRRERKEARS